MKHLLFYIFISITCLTHAQNLKIVVKLSDRSVNAKNKTISELKTLASTYQFNIRQFHNIPIKQNSFDKYKINNIYIIKVKKEGSVNEIANSIRKLGNIEYVEPYPISYVYSEPNDPRIGSQYYLDRIEAYAAHEITTGDTNVVIGIVDTGFDLLHEDLKNNYKYNYNDPINNIDDDGDGFVDNFYGWDVANWDNNPQSEANFFESTNYHGTNVAGIAAATTNNNIGIASIGYNTKIMPIKAMDGSGQIVAGYEGIMYAATHGCQIINLSWGNNVHSTFAQDVINHVSETYECLVIAAAGNRRAATDKRPDTWFYPASYKNVFSVAATGPSDIRWDGSSYAATVDVSAPGQNMQTTNQFDQYKYTNGTSSAAPLASGLAALLKAYRPELTNKQLAQQIRITSDNIDTLPENAFYSKKLGFGRINALRTLTEDKLPAIRIDSICFSSFDGDIDNTLSVSFIASNYLAQATNTTIRLKSTSDYIIPINNTLQTGKMGTFDQVSNTTTPFLFEVHDELPYNEMLWFDFEMIDDGYNDYQVFETIIKKDFLNVAQGNLKTTLTSNGKIAYVNWDKELGIGIKYKEEDIVSNAGIILGNGPDNMASALFNVEEFDAIEIVDTNSTEKGINGFCKLKTGSDLNLQLEINYDVTIPHNEDLSNTIIHTYNINSKSNSTIENLKLSQFVDWDLSNSVYNTVVYLDEYNMAYTYSTTSNVIYSAICLLNEMKATPYAFDMIAGGNGGIDITQGFSNDLKWFTMNNNRDTAGASINADIASMLTSDFFSLNNNDSIEIAFAHIIGDNLNELKTKASKLREDYNKKVGINSNITAFEIYPNPATNNIYLKSAYLNGSTISIYNNAGKLVYANNANTTNNTAHIDISNFSNSVYIVKIEKDSISESRKLIITD